MNVDENGTVFKIMGSLKKGIRKGKIFNKGKKKWKGKN